MLHRRKGNRCWRVFPRKVDNGYTTVKDALERPWKMDLAIKFRVFCFARWKIEIFQSKLSQTIFCSNWFHAITHSSKKNDFRGHPTINFNYAEHTHTASTFNFHLIFHCNRIFTSPPRYLSQSFKSIVRALIVYLFSLQASIRICPFRFVSMFDLMCAKVRKLCVDWTGANEACIQNTADVERRWRPRRPRQQKNETYVLRFIHGK